MPRDPQVERISIPETPQETAVWFRMLVREVNTYVLFLQTWGAMGFVVDPEVVSSLIDLQSKVLEARSRLSSGYKAIEDSLKDIANEEERVYRMLTDEIKRFKEEQEGIFPTFKMNFDPCF